MDPIWDAYFSDGLVQPPTSPDVKRKGFGFFSSQNDRSWILVKGPGKSSVLFWNPQLVIISISIMVLLALHFPPLGNAIFHHLLRPCARWAWVFGWKTGQRWRRQPFSTRLWGPGSCCCWTDGWDGISLKTQRFLKKYCWWQPKIRRSLTSWGEGSWNLPLFTRFTYSRCRISSISRRAGRF